MTMIQSSIYRVRYSSVELFSHDERGWHSVKSSYPQDRLYDGSGRYTEGSDTLQLDLLSDDGAGQYHHSEIAFRVPEEYP
jgi:hypothetical protein